jgi:calcium/calmodulin-dependent protein kinase I
MREVVDAVAYLHSMGIAHLDLKPENVLLKSDETDASDVRLVDFGSARFVGSDRIGGAVGAAVGGGLRSERSKAAGPAGATPAYAAPEVLRGDAYDESADVWSLGVILYLLLTGARRRERRRARPRSRSFLSMFGRAIVPRSAADARVRNARARRARVEVASL